MNRLIFILLCLPLWAQAGVMNGGGGIGVSCQIDGKQQIELLDLYEAKAVHNFIPETSHANLEEEFYFGLQRMNQVWQHPDEVNNIDRYIEQLMKDFFKKVSHVPEGQRLSFTNDATLPHLPANCRFVQIAVYNENTVFLDQEYWNALDGRNKAALILHEEIYFFRRGYGAKNSDEVRGFVGQIFSTTPPTPKFYDQPMTGYFECSGASPEAGDFSFWVYPASQGMGYIASFNRIGGVTTLGRTTAFITDPQVFKHLTDPGFDLDLHLKVHSQSNNKIKTLWLSRVSQSRLKITEIIERMSPTPQEPRFAQIYCKKK